MGVQFTNEDDYAEKDPNNVYLGLSKSNAFKLAKKEMENIKTLDQLVAWWSEAPEIMKGNKKVQDLKDSKKAELKVLQ